MVEVDLLNLENDIKAHEFKVLVNKLGKLDDYLNMPIVKDEIAIGIVTKAEELDDKYELSYYLFKEHIQIEVQVKHRQEVTVEPIALKIVSSSGR